MSRGPTTRRRSTRIRGSGPRSATRPCGRRWRGRQKKRTTRRRATPAYRPVKTHTNPVYAYQRSPDQDGPSVRHPVIVVGAGPVGLATAIDLALHDVPVVVLDDDSTVSVGSRAICYAKRALEILDRLGCGERIVEKGVEWKI